MNEPVLAPSPVGGDVVDHRCHLSLTPDEMPALYDWIESDDCPDWRETPLAAIQPYIRDARCDITLSAEDAKALYVWMESDDSPKYWETPLDSIHGQVRRWYRFEPPQWRGGKPVYI